MLDKAEIHLNVGNVDILPIEMQSARAGPVQTSMKAGCDKACRLSSCALLTLHSSNKHPAADSLALSPSPSPSPSPDCSLNVICKACLLYSNLTLYTSRPSKHSPQCMVYADGRAAYFKQSRRNNFCPLRLQTYLWWAERFALLVSRTFCVPLRHWLAPFDVVYTSKMTPRPPVTSSVSNSSQAMLSLQVQLYMRRA